MRIRIGLILIGLSWAVATRADTIPMGQICQELRTDSPLSLGPSVPSQLATNLLWAQSQVQYGSLESLNLSIESVLRAIGLYVWVGGPTSITSASAEPLVWLQSTIAIDPSLTVGLSPSSLYFGSKEVPVSTAEPTPFTLALLGLGLGAIWWGLQVPRGEHISRRLRRYRRVQS